MLLGAGDWYGALLEADRGLDLASRADSDGARLRSASASASRRVSLLETKATALERLGLPEPELATRLELEEAFVARFGESGRSLARARNLLALGRLELLEVGGSSGDSGEARLRSAVEMARGGRWDWVEVWVGARGLLVERLLRRGALEEGLALGRELGRGTRWLREDLRAFGTRALFSSAAAAEVAGLRAGELARVCRRRLRLLRFNATGPEYSQAMWEAANHLAEAGDRAGAEHLLRKLANSGRASRLPLKVWSRVRLGGLLAEGGRWDEARAALSAALKAAERNKDPLQVALASRARGDLEGEAGRWAEAQAALGRAVEAYRTLGDWERESQTTARRLQFARAAGDGALARRIHAEGRDFHESGGRSLSLAHLHMAHLFLNGADLSWSEIDDLAREAAARFGEAGQELGEAEALLQRGVAVLGSEGASGDDGGLGAAAERFEKAGLWARVADARAVSALIARMRGDDAGFEADLGRAEAAIGMIEDAGERFGALARTLERGASRLSSEAFGRLADRAEALAETLASGSGSGSDASGALSTILKIRMRRALEEGDGASASAAGRRALELATARGEEGLLEAGHFHVFLARAEISASGAAGSSEDSDKGRLESAAEHARRASEIFRGRGAGSREALCGALGVLAGALAQSERYGEASSVLEELSGLHRESGAREEEARALRMLGQCRLDTQDVEGARSAFERSLELLEGGVSGSVSVSGSSAEGRVETLLKLAESARDGAEARSRLEAALEAARGASGLEAEGRVRLLWLVGEQARESDELDLASAAEGESIETLAGLSDRGKAAGYLVGLAVRAKDQGLGEAARRAADAAEGIQRERGDADGLARALLLQADVARDLEDWETELSKLEEARAGFEELGEEEARAHCDWMLGKALARRGDGEGARAAVERSMGYHRRKGNWGEAMACWVLLGTIARDRMEGERARRCFLEALSASERTGDAERIAVSQQMLSELAFARSDYAEAWDWIGKARATQRAAGNPRGEAESVGFQANLARAELRFEDAERYLREAEGLFAAAGDASGRAKCEKALGQFYRERMDSAKAREAFERAAERAMEAGEPAERAEALNALGRLARESADYGRARELYAEARALASGWGAKAAEAEATRELARLARERGSLSEARVLLSDLEGLLGEVGDKERRADAALELAELGRMLTRSDEARFRAMQALELYRELGNTGGSGSASALLGDLARRDGSLSEARDHYRRALAPLREAGKLAEEARCLKALGHLDESAEASGGSVSGSGSDSGSRGGSRSREFLESAGRLFGKLGDWHQQADCAAMLGDLHRRRREWSESRVCYEQAFQLYSRLGIRPGMADCARNLGDLAETVSDAAEARRFYEEARRLYRLSGNAGGESECRAALERLGAGS